MRILFKLGSIIFCFSFCFYSIYAAEWSILVYMQADNNLSEFVGGDMQEMATGLAMAGVDTTGLINVLTQVDFPQDKKTWRFIVTPKGKIEHGSLTQEMGKEPVEELVASARWMHDEFHANKYALILWNHGSGIEDYRSPLMNNSRQKFNSYWMDIFNNEINQTKEKALKFKDVLKARGLGRVIEPSRGILYDDSEGTCLTNQGLSDALMRISSILEKKIDIVGMDACLMSMVEVAYQIKDYADILVGSQETEPGYGWNYEALAALAANPFKFGAVDFAKTIVSFYENFYKSNNTSDYTQSAINLNLINSLRQNIDNVSTFALECLKYKYSAVRSAVRAARSRTKSFEVANYIDLFSFYRELHAEATKLRHDAENGSTATCCAWLSAKDPAQYIPALDNLIECLNSGMALISNVVVSNVAGSACQGANGISIYYPSSALTIHPSYPLTLFAQQSNWFNFIKTV